MGEAGGLENLVHRRLLVGVGPIHATTTSERVQASFKAAPAAALSTGAAKLGVVAVFMGRILSP